jgi:hypothetical protein
MGDEPKTSDPFTWSSGYVAFDMVELAPCVVRVTDTDHPEKCLDKAAIIGKTEEAVWRVLAKMYGSKDEWIRTRFGVRPMPNGVVAALNELQERLGLDGFLDDENSYRVRMVQ